MWNIESLIEVLANKSFLRTLPADSVEEGCRNLGSLDF